MIVDAMQINHKIQPMVGFWNIPEPTNTVRNARDGKHENDRMRSQFSLEILPL
jgi:hypothetical protein